MTTISGAHEEASLDGTSISHIPLVGRPEFAGLVPGMDTGDDASVMIRDGALSIVTDDLDLALAWRNAWQSACSALIEFRERGGIPHPDAATFARVRTEDEAATR